MAEIVTGTTTGFVNTADLLRDHSDIRREAAEHTSTLLQESMKGFDRVNADVLRTGSDGRYSGAQNTSEIIKEGLKESFAARGDTKDTRYDLASRIGDSADRITGLDTQYYIASQQNANEAARELAALKVLTDANTFRLSAELSLGIEKAAAATALESARLASAVALGQSQLSKEIFADGAVTRGLINDLKYHDLNRALVERNTELVEERHHGRHWRETASQNQFGAQFAQLQSMMQNFNSQLNDTRQGMVNFGTMRGVEQASTSNNVR